MSIRGSKPLAKAGGFSFLEVLLALALFSMASAVLTTSLTTALILRERGDALDLTQHALGLVRKQVLLEPVREDAERGAELDLPFGGRARWRATIEATELVNLFAVELTVSIDGVDAQSDGEHTQTLLLLRPTWSLSEDRTALVDEKRRLLERERAFSTQTIGGVR